MWLSVIVTTFQKKFLDKNGEQYFSVDIMKTFENSYKAHSSGKVIVIGSLLESMSSIATHI